MEQTFKKILIVALAVLCLTVSQAFAQDTGPDANEGGSVAVDDPGEMTVPSLLENGGMDMPSRPLNHAPRDTEESEGRDDSGQMARERDDFGTRTGRATKDERSRPAEPSRTGEPVGAAPSAPRASR